MMKKLTEAALAVALSAATMGCVALAQTPASPAPLGCENGHKIITPKNPRMGTDGDILPGQAIVQLEIPLGKNATARVVEYPRSIKERDSYNSTIIIQRGQERKEYALGRLIKFGSVLRLVEIASFCTAPDRGIAFLAFETPSIGAAEGFAAIRYSSETVDVQVLPIVNQGRIVVSKADPTRVELWSATGSASVIDCDACDKHYSIQSCEIGRQTFMCNQQAGPGKIRSPRKFIGSRIEVR